MKTTTITVSEYANRYGCSREFVSRQLRKGTAMTGMVSWRKIEGRTGSWMIEVLKSWYGNMPDEDDYFYDSDDPDDPRTMGLNNG